MLDFIVLAVLLGMYLPILWWCYRHPDSLGLPNFEEGEEAEY